MKNLTRTRGTHYPFNSNLRDSAALGKSKSGKGRIAEIATTKAGQSLVGISRQPCKLFTALFTFAAGIAPLLGIHAFAQDSSTNQTSTVPTTSNPAPAQTVQNPTPPSSMYDTTPALRPARPAKNEVSASGDFFLGQGTVSVPFGFSIAHTLGSGANVHPVVEPASRTSVYFGGTLSYSYGQAWYLDFSYLQGQQTGPTEVTVPFTVNGPLRTKFNISDDWYQIYARYTFPSLRGKPFSAYLRAGFTYVSADLTASGINIGYHQTDNTSDYLGKVGFGVAYNIVNSRRFRVYLQAEGEGFGGTRTQDSLETLAADTGKPQSATINNTVFGGIGRGTGRLEYRMGRSGLFKIFLDGGIQGQFSEVSYPSTGSQSENLWGPYVKIGARYSF